MSDEYTVDIVYSSCLDIRWDMPIFANRLKSCGFCPQNLWCYWTNPDQICKDCTKSIAIIYL